MLDAVFEHLAALPEAYAGCVVEHKGLTLAAHYGGVAPAAASLLRRAVLRARDRIEAREDRRGVGDRIAVLNAGVIQQLGTPSQLYDTPANLFVARFIGSPGMNLIKSQVEANGAGVRLRSGGDPVLHLANPASVPADARRRSLDALRDRLRAGT